MNRFTAVALVLLVAVLGAGCGGEDNNATPTPAPATSTTVAEASPSVTATAPTATAAAGDGCPLNQTACDFADQLEGWLTGGDFTALAERLRVSSFECPGGTPSGAGGPFPLCEDAAAGEQRNGVSVARRYSEGAVISVEAYEAFLAEFIGILDSGASDDIGPGTLGLYALGCLDGEATPDTCNRFTVIFSGIPGGTCCPPLGAGGLGRELLVFFVEATSGGDAEITSTWTGIIQEPEMATIFGEGGNLFDLGRVYPLD